MFFSPEAVEESAAIYLARYLLFILLPSLEVSQLAWRQLLSVMFGELIKQIPSMTSKDQTHLLN